MIKIDSIKLSAKQNTDPIEYAKEKYFRGIDCHETKILKKSIDSRDKNDICYVYTLAFKLNEKDEAKLIKKYKNISDFKEKTYFVPHSSKIDSKAVVVGAGPAGLFCAYILCLAGIKPIIVERGKDADSRQKDVDKLFSFGTLNCNSNIQFGEGGAGTFSDGKLNTGIKDKEGRIDFVLNTFVKFGAQENILYDAKPHIGTDILINVVKNMRVYIEKSGGQYMFCKQLTEIDFNSNRLKGITVKDTVTGDETYISCDYLCLAIGHSARDTFYYLKNKLNMSQKPFAMGFRVIHTQEFVNKAQYGDNYENLYENLPASPYKLTYTSEKTQRGVYSFCMCPGGYVVNASSEENKLCVNGMSNSKRDSGYANSAIIVQILPKDFDTDDALAGAELQRKTEHNAFLSANGKIPICKYSDFSGEKLDECNIIPDEAIKGQFEHSDLSHIFPEFVNESIIDGFDHFDSIIKGFKKENPLLAGVEARTSSPVRIERDENLESNIKGIFPCGEGAGYAGGIVSAAVDGIKVAEKILQYGV